MTYPTGLCILRSTHVAALERCREQCRAATLRFALCVKACIIFRVARRQHARVAQRIRAADYGSAGRRFESCLAHSGVPKAYTRRVRAVFGCFSWIPSLLREDDFPVVVLTDETMPYVSAIRFGNAKEEAAWETAITDSATTMRRFSGYLQASCFPAIAIPARSSATDRNISTPAMKSCTSVPPVV